MLFINGLPVVAFELKSSLPKHTVADAVEPCRLHREPSEILFELGRRLAHFAMHEHEARSCTHLTANVARCLPFNRVWNDSGGSPTNPDGIKTA